MPSERRKSTGHRDSGAVAIETAAVSMLLITILFGIVESSFLFKDWITVSAAARAGARMGVSQPRSPSFAQDTANQVANAVADLDPANIQEVWVYKAAVTANAATSTNKPFGFTDFSNCTVCVKYVWNAGTHSLTQSSGNWSYTSQNACAGDSARDSLGVYVKYRHTSPLKFFFNNLTVSESAVMWIEPTSAAICKP
jgi:Flp pilus assembly protein TadG